MRSKEKPGVVCDWRLSETHTGIVFGFCSSLCFIFSIRLFKSVSIENV